MEFLSLHKKYRVTEQIMANPSFFLYASSATGRATSSAYINLHNSYDYLKFYPQSLKFYYLSYITDNAVFLYNKELDKSYEISLTGFLNCFERTYENSVKIWAEINDERADF